MSLRFERSQEMPEQIGCLTKEEALVRDFMIELVKTLEESNETDQIDTTT